MAITAQEQDGLAGALTEIGPHLNERQWRLLLGAQARAVGRGGIRLVARVAGAGPRREPRPDRQGARGVPGDALPTHGRRHSTRAELSASPGSRWRCFDWLDHLPVAAWVTFGRTGPATVVAARAG